MSRLQRDRQKANVAAMLIRAKPDIRERFGFAVKTRREELNLTQEDLADKAASIAPISATSSAAAGISA